MNFRQNAKTLRKFEASCKTESNNLNKNAFIQHQTPMSLNLPSAPLRIDDLIVVDVFVEFTANPVHRLPCVLTFARVAGHRVVLAVAENLKVCVSQKI